MKRIMEASGWVVKEEPYKLNLIQQPTWAPRRSATTQAAKEGPYKLKIHQYCCSLDAARLEFLEHDTVINAVEGCLQIDE